MHFKTQLQQTNITLATTTGIPTPGWKTFHKSKHDNKNRAGAKQLVQKPNHTNSNAHSRSNLPHENITHPPLQAKPIK